jgi:hypothetical protein
MEFIVTVMTTGAGLAFRSAGFLFARGGFTVR